MKKIVCLLFILLIFCSTTYAKEINFIQVSDIHFSLNEPNTEKYLSFLTLAINKKKPDFTAFLGDNIDKSKELNLLGFMQLIYSIKKPYYIILGNHDAYSAGGIEKKEYMDIISVFNHNQKRKKTYFNFRINRDAIGIVLDVNSNFVPSKHGKVPDEQVNWLDNLLTKNSDKLFFIFQHVPLLPPRTEYERSLINTEYYSNMLRKHKNVILISSGHYHQEMVRTDSSGIVHISAPAFKNKPYQYQMIKVIYNKDKEITRDKIKVIVKTIKV